MNTPAQCGVIKPPKTDIYSEAPYRGVAANHLWLTTRAAAVNLVRLTNLGVTHNNGAFTL